MKKYIWYGLVFLLLCGLFFFGYLAFIQGKSFSLGQNIAQGRNDFWAMETMQQYSVNLHYGVSINEHSIIEYGYILFIIIAILVALFRKLKKTQKFKIIFYVGIGMFLFVGIRNTISYTSILHEGLLDFKGDRVFFDLGDYIGFIEKIRDELDLDSGKIKRENCKIFINEYRHRAIVQHGKLYLVPCDVIPTGKEADYKVYYKTNIPFSDRHKKILVEFNNSYLLDNNSR